MKIALKISALYGILILNVIAFDPDGPPPEKTMLWTTDYINRVTIPKVNFVESTAEEAVLSLTQSYIPKAYKVEINGSKLGELAHEKVSFELKDVTVFEAVGVLANSIGADILIKPGKIYLVPATKE